MYMENTKYRILSRKGQRVAAWGTGAGVRLSKALMHEVGLSLGQEIELIPVDDGILLRPSRPVFDIKELVSQMTDENRHELIDFGPDVGSEVIDD